MKNKRYWTLLLVVALFILIPASVCCLQLAVLYFIPQGAAWLDDIPSLVVGQRKAPLAGDFRIIGHLVLIGPDDRPAADMMVNDDGSIVAILLTGYGQETKAQIRERSSSGLWSDAIYLPEGEIPLSKYLFRGPEDSICYSYYHRGQSTIVHAHCRLDSGWERLRDIGKLSKESIFARVNYFDNAFHIAYTEKLPLDEDGYGHVHYFNGMQISGPRTWEHYNYDYFMDHSGIIHYYYREKVDAFSPTYDVMEIISNDIGKTWSPPRRIDYDYGFSRSTILKDGSIILAMREKNGRPYFFISLDGEAWKPYYLQVHHPLWNLMPPGDVLRGVGDDNDGLLHIALEAQTDKDKFFITRGTLDTGFSPLQRIITSDIDYLRNYQYHYYDMEAFLVDGHGNEYLLLVALDRNDPMDQLNTPITDFGSANVILVEILRR